MLVARHIISILIHSCNTKKQVSSENSLLESFKIFLLLCRFAGLETEMNSDHSCLCSFLFLLIWNTFSAAISDGCLCPWDGLLNKFCLDILNLCFSSTIIYHILPKLVVNLFPVNSTVNFFTDRDSIKRKKDSTLHK